MTPRESRIPVARRVRPAARRAAGLELYTAQLRSRKSRPFERPRYLTHRSAPKPSAGRMLHAIKTADVSRRTQMQRWSGMAGAGTAERNVVPTPK
ncbi:hypothetical protein PsYK624_155770 [Phanerochaete sordida]|uniref:Uncharacterized protein n=1 Tax=Phanerochaete sordida TaxID=48140 RepID=A0A9P3GQP1_9APHY|nr:hypothetical protein PsYK624_155770 [Phanerochaete sordida]